MEHSLDWTLMTGNSTAKGTRLHKAAFCLQKNHYERTLGTKGMNEVHKEVITGLGTPPSRLDLK